jgi:ABC-type nitrate/sulfonate/bicarbonate transport system permease component
MTERKYSTDEAFHILLDGISIGVVIGIIIGLLIGLSV